MVEMRAKSLVSFQTLNRFVEGRHRLCVCVCVCVSCNQSSSILLELERLCKYRSVVSASLEHVLGDWDGAVVRLRVAHAVSLRPLLSDELGVVPVMRGRGRPLRLWTALALASRMRRQSRTVQLQV